MVRDTLRITEIYCYFQNEIRAIGLTTVFLCLVRCLLRCYLTPDVAVRLASAERGNQPVSLLTKRERQVSELLSKGLDVKSVAHQLGLSPKTVHVHRANAMDKLGVKNNVELARLFNEEDNPAL